jgi:hypothetical protein
MNSLLWAGRSLAFSLLFALAASATSIPRISFEQLTDRSELIFSGQVTRSWSDWDAEHKFIWTHYEFAASGSFKGNLQSTVVVSEPGGVVGNRGMTIAGAVAYQIGDKVVVIAQRMPNGYLRTTGWGQGKYLVDSSGRLHAGSSLRGIETTDAGFAAADTPLRSLEGMSAADLRTRIAERLLTIQGVTR